MSCRATETKKQTTTSSPAPGVLQRKCKECGQHSAGAPCASCGKKQLQRQPVAHTSHSEVPPIVHEVLRSPGRPLDVGTRAMFEPRFGRDFSHVRVHTDSRAAASARSVDAAAYTVGNHVVFGTGQHQPGTQMGNAVLAHELTHVAQQPNHNALGNRIVLGATDTTQEREAESVAAKTSGPNGGHGAGRARQNLTNSTAGVIQRIGPAAAVGLGAAGVGLLALGFLGAGAIDYLLMTRARAERFANELDTTYAGWLNQIPNCPCHAPTAEIDPTGGTDDRRHWVWDDNPDLQDAHPGASSSYRSKTIVNRHGQQCTYDAHNNLITGGAGAGTPDFYGPYSTINIPYHIVYDYKTFKELHWQRYTQTWRPDNRRGCPVNVI